MLQLNRAKFSANGSCGYVLKPQCMCQGENTALEPPKPQCMCQGENTALEPPPCQDLEPLLSPPLHKGPRVRRP